MSPQDQVSPAQHPAPFPSQPIPAQGPPHLLPWLWSTAVWTPGHCRPWHLHHCAQGHQHLCPHWAGEEGSVPHQGPPGPRQTWPATPASAGALTSLLWCPPGFVPLVMAHVLCTCAVFPVNSGATAMRHFTHFPTWWPPAPGLLSTQGGPATAGLGLGTAELLEARLPQTRTTRSRLRPDGLDVPQTPTPSPRER